MRAGPEVNTPGIRDSRKHPSIPNGANITLLSPDDKIKAMPSLEYCREHADALAQEVVNAWAVHFREEDMPPDFKALLELACQYQTVKSDNDSHREFNRLSELKAAREVEKRDAFCKVCNEYQDKHPKVGKK